jgi:hypothetical protein
LIQNIDEKISALPGDVQAELSAQLNRLDVKSAVRGEKLVTQMIAIQGEQLREALGGVGNAR